MVFPIVFSKRGGSYDCISPLINLTGNAAVVAVGGISLAVIAYIALKALGFSKTVRNTVTAGLVTIGTIGAIGAATVGSFIVIMCMGMKRR